MKQREGDRGDKGEEMRGRRRREGEGERWGGEEELINEG